MNTNSLRFAVIGHPISHSRSPDIHQAFARQCGVNVSYTRIDAEPSSFESTVSAFFNGGGRGLNVTVPFKERAWTMASAHLSQRARLAGAVNTLWQADGALHGCNTDGIGLVRDLTRLQMLSPGNRILLIGAGGAARGVIGPLLAAGCERLHIVNRTATRAEALVMIWRQQQAAGATRLSSGGFDSLSAEPGWDLIINATATSLHGETLPIPSGLWRESGAVYDMMYGAQPTAFMVQAQAEGAQRLADGLGMLVAQAAESFRIWNGVEPAIEPVIDLVRGQMRSAVR